MALPTTVDPTRIALNRVTFGARDLDLANVNAFGGFEGWLQDQLNAPPGDDPDLVNYLGKQTMHIQYAAPTANQPNGTWSAVNEDRALSYLNAPPSTLWAVGRQAGSTYSFAERFRIRQELIAATWIRNAHAKYQVREFMTDFWHNHFNIGKNENDYATAMLPLYDSRAIRPYVFGNFRQMLEANATSSSMLIYLDNWVSTATTPNENYAREIMELHTLGGGAYLGIDNSAGAFGIAANGVASGFTDQDVIQGSRALSGWTVQYGQRDANNKILPNTGDFIYNAAQHNTKAGAILNVDVSGLTASQAQGRKFMDIIAYHPATANFVVGKLARRIFGDTPPAAVIARGVAAWNANQQNDQQIRKVLEAMLLGGDNEVLKGPIAKVRRPYERLIAMARTTDMLVGASTDMTSALDSMNDGIFAWQAPNGRPDVNSYWLATGATLTTWNLLFAFPGWATNTTTLTNQTPADSLTSSIGVVDYWVGRMVGAQLAQSSMNALYSDQAGSGGVPATVRASTSTPAKVESALRRLTSLIATSEEFTYR